MNETTRSTETPPVTLESMTEAIQKLHEEHPDPMTPRQVLLEQYLATLGIRIGPWTNLNPLGADYE